MSTNQATVQLFSFERFVHQRGELDYVITRLPFVLVGRGPHYRSFEVHAKECRSQGSGPRFLPDQQIEFGSDQGCACHPSLGHPTFVYSRVELTRSHRHVKRKWRRRLASPEGADQFQLGTLALRSRSADRGIGLSCD